MTEWRFFKFIQSFSHLVILKKFFPKIIAIIGSHILLSRQGKILSSLMTFLFAIFFAKVVRNNYSP